MPALRPHPLPRRSAERGGLKPFALLYVALCALLYVAAFPILLFLRFKPKYRRSIPARFFGRDNPPFAPNGLWFHACSVGETRALKPLLDVLKTHEIRISTITQTGQTVAKSYNAEVRYLPFELFMPWWARPQKALVVLEAEFWYLLFAAAKAKGAKVILLNARISERSFPKYRKMRWFYRRLFALADKTFCQSNEDKTRLEALGAVNVEVLGNIKLARKIEATERYAKPPGETIIAASTHEGEEALIFDAFMQHRAEHPDSRLIVVPRHPERFDAVWEFLRQKSTHLDCVRWSYDKRLDADIVLVDAMGELNNIYAVSDIAVLGGAFKTDVGGHNPLEPAHFGCRLITGKHFFNQRELMRYVDHAQSVEPGDIAEALNAARTMPPAEITGGFDLGRIADYLNRLEEQP